MYKPEKKIINLMRQTRLTNDERAHIRSAVLEYAASHSLDASIEQGGFRNGYGIHLYFMHLSKKSFAIVSMILVLLIAAGGTSFAAEAAVPGDALYQIKIRVNEEVRALVALTPQAQAQWNVERTTRRLEEAEKLAAQGRLNTETTTLLADKFNTHSQDVRNIVQMLNDESKLDEAAALASNFEATLRAHNAILSRIKTQTYPNIETLLDKMENETIQSENIQSVIRESIMTTTGSQARTSAEGKKKSAENKIAESQKSFIQIQNTMSAGSQNEIKEILDQASTLIQNANDQMQAQDFGKAFTLYQQAHRNAQEAKLLMKAHKDIGLQAVFEEKDESSNTITTPTPEFIDDSNVGSGNDNNKNQPAFGQQGRNNNTGSQNKN